ncbi:TRAP transporter permease [Fodinicurvata sp. EGI_FJ10296]|uniref:TRAP transporter permease n=1 Tax=Fodinicurvata sp. EGI_FJ10296 TaxID=3231908 RepID=UPI003451FB08
MNAKSNAVRNTEGTQAGALVVEGVDQEPVVANQREFSGWQGWLFFILCILFTSIHLYSLNISPIETWAFRILHIGGALLIGFIVMAAFNFDDEGSSAAPGWVGWLKPASAVITIAAIATGAYALGCIAYAYILRDFGGGTPAPDWTFSTFGPPMFVSALLAILASWTFQGQRNRMAWPDILLGLLAMGVAAYLLFHLQGLRMRAGTSFALIGDFWAAMTGVLLILELTRRVAGLALVAIAGIFVLYAFGGPFLPGILEHRGYSIQRFFTYLYTDSGILGPTIAVSSTYIILFITFAAFLQASKVGDYFVNFAFAVAGRTRGGPAKVAVFASGLMGMINGTSAGNVVATGSLTIPLMKRVGYPRTSAGAIEAAASTGGQIMPPIMGAGAFIMVEITGIPYTEIVVAALIPAILYFLSIFFMVDLEATKLGMRGMKGSELPRVADLAKQIFLFLPIVILIGALFMGYSVIRAGTLAMVSAVIVSWLTPYRMGPSKILDALDRAAKMSIQIIAVCACAGIIVGVISMTGIGQRFSSMLLGVAEASQLLAMFFAMCISILLGMGMPTTAAYAVAASVVAPGLIQLGVQPLVAHFFVFYFAVVSAITPPVALASYAASAISGADPLRTSIASFKIGLAAFVVPFMFFYSPAILMDAEWPKIIQVFITATIGIYLLAAAVQGWFFGRMNVIFRIILLAASISLIQGHWLSDLAGIGVAVAMAFWQSRVAIKEPLPKDDADRELPDTA